MHLSMGQLYDARTLRQVEKFCVAEVLMPHEHINAACLKYAVKYLLHKYPVLRACFTKQDDEWIMHFLSIDEVSENDAFQVYYAQSSYIALTEQLQNYANSVLASILLERPPLFRFALFDSTESYGQRLVFIYNHLICDGISTRILWRDLSRAYKNALAGEMPVPEQCNSYQAFVAELTRKHRQITNLPIPDTSVRKELGFLDRLTRQVDCKTTLADVQHCCKWFRGSSLKILRDYVATFGVGLGDFLLGCWIVTLCRTQHQDMVETLVWISPHFVGQWDTPVNELVGSVSFPLPVTFSLSGSLLLKQAVQQVTEQMQAALAGAEAFAARYFADAAICSWPSLPAIGFNFVSSHRLSASLINYEIAPERISIERSSDENFDLALWLEIEIYGEEMQITMCAAPSVTHHFPLESMMETFSKLLTASG